MHEDNGGFAFHMTPLDEYFAFLFFVVVVVILLSTYGVHFVFIHLGLFTVQGESLHLLTSITSIYIHGWIV